MIHAIAMAVLSVFMLSVDAHWLDLRGHRAWVGIVGCGCVLVGAYVCQPDGGRGEQDGAECPTEGRRAESDVLQSGGRDHERDRGWISPASSRRRQASPNQSYGTRLRSAP